MNIFLVASNYPSRFPPDVDMRRIVHDRQGMHLLGGNEDIARVEATPDAVEALRRDYGDDIIIEPVIEHQPLA